MKKSKLKKHRSTKLRLRKQAKSEKRKSAKLRLRKQNAPVTARTAFRFAGIVGDGPKFNFKSDVHQKLTERWRSWASEGLGNWTAMTPIQQTAALNDIVLTDALWRRPRCPAAPATRGRALNDIVLTDALWQLWLSHDGKEFWNEFSKNEKIVLIQYCVEESIWWRNFMVQEEEWNWKLWPWQKQYAFLRTAGRKAMNMELEHPINVQLVDADTDDMDASTEAANTQMQLERSTLQLTDPKRSLLITQMEAYAKKWDEE